MMYNLQLIVTYGLTWLTWWAPTLINIQYFRQPHPQILILRIYGDLLSLASTICHLFVRKVCSKNWVEKLV